MSATHNDKVASATDAGKGNLLTQLTQADTMHPDQFVLQLVVVVALSAAEALSLAMRRAGVQQKEVAIDMGYTEPRLSQALRRQRPLDLHRLMECDPRVVRALGEVLVEAGGGEPPLTRRTLRAELAHVARLIARAERRTA